jgi:hypothetical protein
MGCPIRCRGTSEINLQKGLSRGWQVAAGGAVEDRGIHEWMQLGVKGTFNL